MEEKKKLKTRISMTIDPELLKHVRKHALDRNMSMSAFISGVLLRHIVRVNNEDHD